MFAPVCRFGLLVDCSIFADFFLALIGWAAGLHLFVELAVRLPSFLEQPMRLKVVSSRKAIFLGSKMVLVFLETISF